MDKKYFNFKMCSACGGACCKRHAGSYAPEDIKEPITAELISELLRGGKHAIDWWEGDVLDRGNNDRNSFYLRPRHKGEKAVVGSWGGVCINWTEQGCSLSEEEKPFQCKHLIPDYNFETKQANCDTDDADKTSKKQMIIRWLPYQEQLSEAIDLFYNRSLAKI